MKILEQILHILHIIYESLKNIGIALAKPLVIIRKSKIFLMRRLTLISSKNIDVANANPQKITVKSKLLLARKITLISFVIISASLVVFSETEVTTIQDGPYVNSQLPDGFYNKFLGNNITNSNNTDQIFIKNITQSPNSRICTNCNGAGFIEETYTAREWISCINCGGDGRIESIDSYMCPVCHGTGWQYKNVAKTREVNCPICKGNGYIPL